MMYVKLKDVIDNLYELCKKDCLNCPYSFELLIEDRERHCELVNFILSIRKDAKELVNNEDL